MGFEPVSASARPDGRAANFEPASVSARPDEKRQASSLRRGQRGQMGGLRVLSRRRRQRGRMGQHLVLLKSGDVASPHRRPRSSSKPRDRVRGATVDSGCKPGGTTNTSTQAHSQATPGTGRRCAGQKVDVGGLATGKSHLQEETKDTRPPTVTSGCKPAGLIRQAIKHTPKQHRRRAGDVLEPKRPE